MARLFHEKYRINPLDTIETMKSLKKIHLRMEIFNEVKRDMKDFEEFYNACTLKNINTNE